jgi:hypothetical protein
MPSFMKPYRPGTVGAKRPLKPFKFYIDQVSTSKLGQPTVPVAAAINGIGIEIAALTGTGALVSAITGVGTITVALVGTGAVVAAITGIGTVTVTGTITAFISGITKDQNSTPLGSCVLNLFLTSNNTLVASTTSDGSGNYTLTFNATITGPFYIVAYKAGSPDVAGTSVNTLVIGS